MKELLRTNDLVLLTYITALLDGVNIESMIADTHTSSMEMGVVQRRLLVDAEDEAAAKRVMIEAGLAKHLRSEDHGRPA